MNMLPGSGLGGNQEYQEWVPKQNQTASDQASPPPLGSSTVSVASQAMNPSHPMYQGVPGGHVSNQLQQSQSGSNHQLHLSSLYAHNMLPQPPPPPPNPNLGSGYEFHTQPHVSSPSKSTLQPSSQSQAQQQHPNHSHLPHVAIQHSNQAHNVYLYQAHHTSPHLSPHPPVCPQDIPMAELVHPQPNNPNNHPFGGVVTVANSANNTVSKAQVPHNVPVGQEPLMFYNNPIHVNQTRSRRSSNHSQYGPS